MCACVYIKFQYIYPAVTINGQAGEVCSDQTTTVRWKVTVPPTCWSFEKLFDKPFGLSMAADENFSYCHVLDLYAYLSWFQWLCVSLRQTDPLWPPPCWDGTARVSGWGSRVGAEHRFRLTEKHGEGNGRETWAEIALVKVSILKDFYLRKKNLPEFKEGREKKDKRSLRGNKERRKTEEEARQGAIKGVWQQAQELLWIWFLYFDTTQVLVQYSSDAVCDLTLVRLPLRRTSSWIELW